MCTLNNKPLHVLQQLPGVVHAATDVTGFGLLGHLRGITKGSNVDCEIDSSAVPLLTDALKLASIPGMQKGGIRFFFLKLLINFSELIPGGTKNNLTYVSPHVTFDPSVAEPLRYLLADAQTSGGILLAVDPSRVDAVLSILRSDPSPLPLAAIIGRFTVNGNGMINVK